MLDSAFLANKMNWVNAAKCRRAWGWGLIFLAGLDVRNF